MSLTRASWSFLAIALTGTVGDPAADAATGVTATKLIVVDKGSAGAKAVFVVKDPAIAKGSGTDASAIGATLDVRYDNGVDPATSGQFDCPSGGNWLVNSANVAKYVNRVAPTDGSVKVAVIKPGNLAKLVARSLGDTPLAIMGQASAPIGMASTQYCIQNDAFSDCFCSTTAGCSWKAIAGGSGAKVVCRGGAPDSTCGAAVTTTSTSSSSSTSIPSTTSTTSTTTIPTTTSTTIITTTTTVATSTTSTTIACLTCTVASADVCGSTDPCEGACAGSPGCIAALSLASCLNVSAPQLCCASPSLCQAAAPSLCPAQWNDCQAN